MARKKKQELLPQIFSPNDMTKHSCAFSRDFAYTQIQHNDMVKWTQTQKKLFMFVLEEIDWTRKGNKNVVELDHKEVALRMGWDYAEENGRKIKHVLENEISEMWLNGKIELRDPISGLWIKDHVIGTIAGDSLRTFVQISPHFMNHFEGMYQTSKKTGVSFPVIMSTDVLSFKSSLTYDFFVKLRLEGAVGGPINTKELSTAEIKNILHLSKKAYTKKVVDKKTGEEKDKFDRTNFEKHVLTTILEDINRSETIQIIKAPDGKLFQKTYLKKQVHKYIIKYRIFDVNAIKARRKQLIAENKKNEDITEMLSNMTTEELNEFIKNELVKDGNFMEAENTYEDL